MVNNTDKIAELVLQIKQLMSEDGNILFVDIDKYQKPIINTLEPLADKEYKSAVKVKGFKHYRAEEEEIDYMYCKLNENTL